MSTRQNKMKFGAKCVHAGEAPDPPYGPHTRPTYQTSTFVFDNAEQGASRFGGKEEGYTYARIAPNTPTHAALVEKIAALEDAETCQTFSSGMAAIKRCCLFSLRARRSPFINRCGLWLYIRIILLDSNQVWHRDHFC